MHPTPRGSLLLPALVLFGGLATTWLTVDAVRRQNVEESQEAFDHLAELALADVRLRLQRIEYGLGGARGAFAAQGGVLDVHQFAAYVAARDMQVEFPGITGYGLIERVLRQDLPAYVARQSAAYGEPFEVTTQGDAPDLYIIRSIEPAALNRAARGFDVGSEHARRAAVQRVHREGLPTVTAPIRLLQDPMQRHGALFMAPVFASGRPIRQGPDDAVLAVVYAAITYDVLLADLQPGAGAPLRLALVDLEADDFGVQVSPSLRDRRLSATEGARFSQVHPITFGGREFVLELSSTTEFSSPLDAVLPRLGMLLGACISLLAAFLLRMALRTRFRARQLAERMTRDLDQLAMVARLTGNAVVITDAQGRISWLNPAFARFSGQPESALIGQPPQWLMPCPDADPEVMARIADAVAERRSFQGEIKLCPDGETARWVELEIQPMRGRDGKDIGTIAILSDITASRQQAEALAASERLLLRTGELARVGGWRVDLPEGQPVWSAQTCRIHEVEEGHHPDLEEAMGFFAPDDRARLAEAFRATVETGEPYDLQLPMRTARGNLRWVRTQGEILSRDGERVSVVGAIQDITRRVEQERALERERQRLADIIEGTGAGTWEWNVQTGEARFNARWAEIVGYTLEELAPVSIQTWLDLAEPTDLERSGIALQEHFSGATRYYEAEARMRHRDGHWVWVQDRGRVLTWTPEGKPEWMFGTHLDISRRKAAELALDEQRRLMAITLRSIGDAVLTTDAEGRVTWLNPVAEALTGWSSAEARGRVAAEVLCLVVEGRPGRAPCPVAACLREERMVSMGADSVLVARDGQRRHAIEDSASPLFTEDGRLLGVVLVFHDVTEKRRLAREMTWQARHDALTGLPNRPEFEGRLAEVLERAHATAPPGALLFLDLDHFKVVNDTCGHSAGDALLVQVAALLRQGVRGGDLVARFGGDEFAVLLDACPMDKASSIAEALCAAVDAYRYQAEDGRRFRVGVSIGVVPLDGRWATPGQAVQAADAACYEAKHAGRGRVVVATGDAPLPGAVGPHWGQRIAAALDEDGFELHAQRVVPLVDTDPSGTLRCEVLLRLREPDGRLVAPGEFMPSVERYQLGSRVDRWVLDRTLAALAAHGAAGVARVAINLSGQSVGDREFHRFACARIVDAGIDPSCLCVEITETTAVTSLPDAMHFIEELRALGVQVALDDFGAGASSFGYLHSLEVDVLKIDGRFIRGLGSSALDEAAVRCFVDVARVLGLRTVAEHIEDADTLAKVQAMGVHFGQGYHFHRPEPLKGLLEAAARGAVVGV